MQKDILFGNEARQKLKKGVDIIAESVVTTLGPKGRNVAFDTAWGRPKVVHDGVTVAKEVELPDSFENMGAQLAREASEKTNDKAGDGTTTSILLAQAIITEGLQSVSSGVNPMSIKKGLEDAVEKVVYELKRVAKKVSSKEEKTQVATISAQDPKIGALIVEAMEKVGDDGVVAIEEGGVEIELEYKDGMNFDRGYASPYFVTNRDKMESVIETPSLLFVDKRMDDVQELLLALEVASKVSKRIVIIAEDFDGPVLSTIVLNNIKGVINALAVKAPGVSTRRKGMLEDMAVLTGATVISKDAGRSLAEITVDDLGKADKVVSTRDDTTIIGGKGKKKDIKERVAHVKELLKVSLTDFDTEKLRRRLAMIASGVAVINVGASSETELKEKKLRVEDAVNATKAAVEEGIVAGGGVALLNARKILKQYDDLGHKIIYKALKYPAKKILENAGLDSGEIISKFEGNKGFNVMTMEYEDMMKSGIIDPAKVTISALKNAVSVAIMVLTTNCLITPTKEELDKQKPIPRYPK